MLLGDIVLLPVTWRLGLPKRHTVKGYTKALCHTGGDCDTALPSSESVFHHRTVLVSTLCPALTSSWATETLIFIAIQNLR